MSIIIFIIILALLIVVHELGHFFAAKISGIRVDEFGLGYPPRAKNLFKWGETVFSLNWIPFGGFVKIFGENPDDDAANGPDSARSFINKPRHLQAFVLVAGVACNILFAWILISLGFMSGLPTSVNSGLGEVENPRLILTSIVPDSPAFTAGLKVGDTVESITGNSPVATLPGVNNLVQISGDDLTPEKISEFISSQGDLPIEIAYSRGDEKGTVSVVPTDGLIEGRKAIGIGMDLIGTLRLPVHKAFWQGARTTVLLTKATTIGLATFLYDAVRGQSDLSQVAGPVGIVGLVGDASKLGFIYVLSFTAFISINLAVINLIPFPALDGGRLLFVAIEAVRRRAINPKIANWLNAVGFVLLILLMVVVTVSDVLKLW